VTFCNQERPLERFGAPKPAERHDWGFVLVLYENYGTRVCGPDGACVQCDDMKETDGLLYEACHPKDIVDQPGCEDELTTQGPPNSTTDSMQREPMFRFRAKSGGPSSRYRKDIFIAAVGLVRVLAEILFFQV